MKYKSMYKYELAAAAGVSPSTLRNWLINYRQAESLSSVIPCPHCWNTRWLYGIE